MSRWYHYTNWFVMKDGHRFVIIFNRHSLFFFPLLLFKFGNSWFAQYFSGDHELFQVFVCLRQTFPLKQSAVRESWPHPSECQSLEDISPPGAHSATRKQSGGVPCTPLGFVDHFKVNDVILSTHACCKPEQLASGIRSCASKRYRKGRSNTLFYICVMIYSAVSFKLSILRWQRIKIWKMWKWCGGYHFQL
jgi:hypothetical protein